MASTRTPWSPATPTCSRTGSSAEFAGSTPAPSVFRTRTTSRRSGPSSARKSTSAEHRSTSRRRFPRTRAELPPTGEGEYYEFQLVGLAVEEEGGRALGRVTAVQPGVANDVLELDSGIALPLVEACVRNVDLEAARILVAPGFAGPS